ncbi:winged helix domain-containing protein [Aureimonas sp. N4]|uniref:winged helix domain-containing protein n=1 Tax=Aureimonas sp. N4 TaxID=1638165 RepID=UPI000785BDA4|nr:hypothetical protein [Aureimonas sp. N4]
MSRRTLRVLVGDAAEPVNIVGRDAWALEALLSAGMIGLTPIDRPAPRWSHYIFKLRGKGIRVETIEEANRGEFKGTHARYVLRSPVTILEDVKG